MQGKGSLTQLLGKQQGKAESTLVERAYCFAEKELKAKDSNHGEERLQHALRSATILSRLGFDDTTIAAALLHDTLTAGYTTAEKIESLFGSDMTLIVAEYAKLLEIEQKNFGKMDTKLLSEVILATAKDIRAIFVKIATRLDVLENPQLIDQKELNTRALVALNIYSPICHKLGLYDLKGVLEDNSLKVLKPTIFRKIEQLVGKTREERDNAVAEAVAEFRRMMQEEKKGVRVEGRAKHFYAIYRKMTEQNKRFDEICDLLGVRIICDSVRECYEVLGIVHSCYEILPNKFTDYIANPKENRYRSIHTVIKWRGAPLEVQIRTWEMHYENETGVAAHWQYKHYAEDKYFDKKLSWAKQLVEWHMKARERDESIKSSLKINFGKNRIFVFTPKKQVIGLPEKSTPIDFAFAIHSDLGYKFGKAKVNGKQVPLSYELENADSIEIIPAKKPQVKRQWLSFAKSNKALSKIRQRLGIKTSKKRKKKPKDTATTADKAVKIARCCNPLPGDEIIGFRTTKRKISIHRKECKNLQKAKKERLVSVSWDLAKRDYSVEIKVHAKETPQLLPTILGIFDEAKVSINSTNAKVNPNDTATCIFNIKINNPNQLETVIKRIGQLPAVFSVERT